MSAIDIHAAFAEFRQTVEKWGAAIGDGLSPDEHRDHVSAVYAALDVVERVAAGEDVAAPTGVPAPEPEPEDHGRPKPGDPDYRLSLYDLADGTAPSGTAEGGEIGMGGRFTG